MLAFQSGMRALALVEATPEEVESHQLSNLYAFQCWPVNCSRSTASTPQRQAAARETGRHRRNIRACLPSVSRAV